MYVRASIFVTVCVYIFARLHACGCARGNVCVCASVCDCLCVHISVRACVRGHVFMSAFVGVCTNQICAGVRTRACARGPTCACIIIQILCVGGSVKYRRLNCRTDHYQI